jgi:hypothetical protein
MAAAQQFQQWSMGQQRLTHGNMQGEGGVHIRSSR